MLMRGLGFWSSGRHVVLLRIKEKTTETVGDTILVLNRRITMTYEGFDYEADAKHSILVRQELGLEHSERGSHTIPGARVPLIVWIPAVSHPITQVVEARQRRPHRACGKRGRGFAGFGGD